MIMVFIMSEGSALLCHCVRIIKNQLYCIYQQSLYLYAEPDTSKIVCLNREKLKDIYYTTTYYQMKLFSNTQRQNNLNVNFEYRNADRLEQSGNPSYGHESNRPQSSKFSFRQDPTTNIMEAISKSDLFSRPSHIRIESGQEQAKQFEPVVAEQRRSLTPRKKIFDPENLTKKLKQSLPNDLKPQNQLKPSQSSFQKSSQKTSSGRHPSSSIQIGTINMPSENVNTPAINQSKWTRGSYKPRLPIIFQQQQQNTKKILTQPILADQRPQKDGSFGSKPSQSIKGSQYSQVIPSLIQRMDNNQKQIANLKNMMQKLITTDPQKERVDPRLERFSRRDMERQRWLLERQRRLNEKQSNMDNRVQRIKEDQAFRSSLERQQIKRLEQLIQENRHLCEKVLEKRMRNSREENLENSKILEAKILKIQEQRQALQRGSYSWNLHNLDISAIPHQRQHKEVNSSQLSSYPFAKAHHIGASSDLTATNPTKSINSSTLIKRRDPAAEVPVHQVRKTKIY